MSNADIEALNDKVFGIDTFYVTGESLRNQSAVVQSRCYFSACKPQYHG